MKITSGSIAVALVLSLWVSVSHAQQSTAIVQTEDSTAASATEPSQPPPTSNAGSGVRIVRLSQVKGEAQLDRKTDRGFEAAFANLPIAQGERLMTNLGVAEVEFEDNSSLRITPDSLIEFPALNRAPSGATVTSVKLLKGTLYVSMANTKGNAFSITFGNSTIALTPSSHIRLDAGIGAGASKATLTVFSGNAQVADSSGTTLVGKKKAFTFDAAATQTSPVLVSKVEQEPFDQWDKAEMDYHKLRSVASAYGNPSYVYGINDLNYYGSFVNVGGCGTMWRPYFTSAAWDPFANGIWAWYPGAGYSWVSPYPWGWTPFHYGSWEYCSTGGGWGWHPGNRWNGLSNHPARLNPNHGPNCPKPPNAPAAGHPTLVALNTRPLAVSNITTQGTFVFRKDSAGLGVPRQSFGKLNRVSSGVARHGFVSTPVFLQSERGPNESNSRESYTHTNGSSTGARSSLARDGSNRNPTHAGQAGRGSQGASHPSSSGGWSGGGGSRSSPSGTGGWSGGGGGGGSHTSSGAVSAGSSGSSPGGSSAGSSSAGGGSHR